MEKTSISRIIYALNHAKINAYFSKNSEDFVVREDPLYEFSGSGEHLILHIEKKDLTTAELLKILSSFCGVKSRDIGYAGLKDKQGLTSQFLSLPKKFEPKFRNFSHEKIKITNQTYHNNKLKIGHLKGNKFFIRLKKVSKVDSLKLSEVLKAIAEMGFANYFGYQRFGRSGENAKSGEEILKNELNFRNKKLNKFLISAYQSEIFNSWLSKRVELSKVIDSFSTQEVKELFGLENELIKILKDEPNFFKILPGDSLGHYPFGKVFLCEDLVAETERFFKKDISVTGRLVGKKALKSVGVAGEFESRFYQNAEKFEELMNGSHRFAWAFLRDLEFRYDEEKAHFTMSFWLPKGSYATTVLAEILHENS